MYSGIQMRIIMHVNIQASPMLVGVWYPKATELYQVRCIIN
jgi:hypothetical protein